MFFVSFPSRSVWNSFSFTIYGEYHSVAALFRRIWFKSMIERNFGHFWSCRCWMLVKVNTKSLIRNEHLAIAFPPKTCCMRLLEASLSPLPGRNRYSNIKFWTNKPSDKKYWHSNSPYRPLLKKRENQILKFGKIMLFDQKYWKIIPSSRYTELQSNRSRILKETELEQAYTYHLFFALLVS